MGFLDLPAELRNRIYGEIVSGPGGLRNRQRRRQIDILATCRKIRHEATGILHDRLSCTFIAFEAFRTPLRFPNPNSGPVILNLPEEISMTHHTRHLTLHATILSMDRIEARFAEAGRDLQQRFPAVEVVTVVTWVDAISQRGILDHRWPCIVRFALRAFGAMPDVRQLRTVIKTRDRAVGDNLSGEEPGPSIIPTATRHGWRWEVMSRSRRVADVDLQGFGDMEKYLVWNFQRRTAPSTV